MDEMDEYQEWLYLTWGFGMESGKMTLSKHERNQRTAADRERPTEGRSDRLAAVDGGAV